MWKSIANPPVMGAAPTLDLSGMVALSAILLALGGITLYRRGKA